MIKLKVADYCQNCPHFEADVDKDFLTSDAGEEICYTTIRCRSWKKCDEISEYLREEMKRNG